MVITRIDINNVRGIEHLVIKQNIQPNRPNILVAPNGFGKSSIATAFKAIDSGKMELKPEEIPVPQKGDPSVSIDLSTGINLLSDKSKNEIKGTFSIHVVSNPLSPTAKAQRFGRVLTAKASMNIEPTVVIKTIPNSVSFDYSLRRLKMFFGDSGKVLVDISSLFANSPFLRLVEKKVNFHVFELKPYKDAVVKVRGIINSYYKQTSESIKNHILDESLFNGFCPDFQKLAELIKYELTLNEVDAYTSAWQFIHIRTSMKGEYKKAFLYVDYKAKKKKLDDTLAAINPFPSRFQLISKERDRSLIVEWPKASLISSGQRDILVFIAQLMECEYQTDGNCILVIDEFFDYLDDANVVAFQYYISKLIDAFKNAKRVLFPILLTHLDPNYLKHFCFNETRLNVVYLKEINARVSDKMAKLIANREQKLVKEVLDAHYFHYNDKSDDVDISKEFADLGLNVDWGRPSVFVKKINRELRTYLLQPNDTYDPLAVCFAVRRRIEELIYNKVDEAHKSKLLATHGTKEKLHEAQNHGVSIPETYFLLGIIYNHPLHSSGEDDTSKALGLKLDNPSIKSMIYHLWA